jgi:hypothetical protein
VAQTRFAVRSLILRMEVLITGKGSKRVFGDELIDVVRLCRDV